MEGDQSASSRRLQLWPTAQSPQFPVSVLQYLATSIVLREISLQQARNCARRHVSGILNRHGPSATIVPTPPWIGMFGPGVADRPTDELRDVAILPAAS